MTFAFIATHRGIWPTGWLCEALGISRAGFYVGGPGRRVSGRAADFTYLWTAEGRLYVATVVALLATGCWVLRSWSPMHW